MPTDKELDQWVAAGLIEPAQAARIQEFAKANSATTQPAAEPRGLQITATEVVAYFGSIVVLVGIGFLYGTRYEQLGPTGRDLILGLVAVAGLGCGFLMERQSKSPAAIRARGAGFFLGVVAIFFLASQMLVDGKLLTKVTFTYGYANEDTSGNIMVAAALATVLAAGLLWRSRAALLALAVAIFTYTTVGAFGTWWHPLDSAWLTEGGYLLGGAILVAYAEALVFRSTRGWAPEVLRFAAVIGPIVVALALSYRDEGLEGTAGFLAVAALLLAIPRRSIGLVISGGLGLFVVVVEVGFRHYAQTLGYPVVLIASGLALLAIAAGMVRVLPLLRGRADRAELGRDGVDLGQENR